MLEELLDGISIVDEETLDIQEDVVHRTWTGQDGFGAESTVDVSRKAIVEQKVSLHKMGDGRLVPTKATLTFLARIPNNGATGRVEPIDPRDVFILADGTFGKAIDVSGIRKGAPLLLQVWLGA